MRWPKGRQTANKDGHISNISIRVIFGSFNFYSIKKTVPRNSRTPENETAKKQETRKVNYMPAINDRRLQRQNRASRNRNIIYNPANAGMPAMLGRRSIYEIPRTPQDLGCIAFVLFFIPATFLFQLCVVMPAFHEPGTFMFIGTWVAGVFVVFNIFGNFLSCLMMDTSIRAHILTPPLEPPLRKMWRFCAHCETLVPLRSWHCDTCRSCILKRDHHCIFAGNCIGHYNQRFFLMFLFYVVIGCAYSCIYNTMYFWVLHEGANITTTTFLNLICPFIGFFLNMSWTSAYLIIFELNVVSLLYAGIMFIFHLPNVWMGSTTYERMSPKFDMGWRKNIKMVFGRRWYYTWISPFVESKLPHDGVHWENTLRLTNKSR